MQTLTGTWLLALDPANRGRVDGWPTAVRPDAQPAPVPGIVQQVFPTHQGVAWYWHTFTPRALPTAGERARLRFGAVEYLAEVWLNGVAVGGHEGAETPFELDATGILRGGDNLLAVRVLKPGNDRIEGLVLAEIPHRHQFDLTQFQPGRCHNSSGLIGAVDLFIVPALRLTDLFARPDAATGRIALTVTVQNDTAAPLPDTLRVAVGLAGPAAGGTLLVTLAQAAHLPPGPSTHELVLTVPQPRCWDLDDPVLYRLTARLGQHELSTRCGFRELCVRDGYFYLNGRRLFLRSSHTCNHFPAGQIVPTEPDLLRRDLLMAKTAGFNCIRWIAGVALPEQLDFCDEIGLMVYEEPYAAWALADSPQMSARYHRSFTEMIRRDRNHPSLTIWGLINEMTDGPVFRCAVAFLPVLRALDPTRLVLLHSGRWDGAPTIGSVSNPGSQVWEPVWGVEGPAAPVVDKRLAWLPGGYLDRAGDAHFYPPLPMAPQYQQQLRTLGQATQPVFLSECGTGSQFNAIDELRGYDARHLPLHLADRTLIAAMAARFTADWERWGLGAVYPFPVDFFRDSYRRHSEQRRLIFDLVRSNPRLCGYNLTGLLDHGITGEGLWSFWRRWKTGIAEVLEDGWSPLRWCLFVTPPHGYAGQPLEIEAVLANEGVLHPGTYPVTFRLWGAVTGVVWERQAKVTIPADGAFAVPVLQEQLALDLPAGTYTFAADLAQGGAPSGDRLDFQLTRAADYPRASGTLHTWGLDDATCAFLRAHGYTCTPYVPAAPGARPPARVLVGDLPPAADQQPTWDALRRDVSAGTTAILLSANPFRTDASSPNEPPRPARPADLPLPWGDAFRAHGVHDWLYHRECVGQRHPLFAGLQTGGILDWQAWGPVLGHAWFTPPPGPCEVLAAGFAVGYCCDGGYASGLLLGRQSWGQGQVWFNSLCLLEHLGRHPAADRLLLNLVAAAASPPPTT